MHARLIQLGTGTIVALLILIGLASFSRNMIFDVAKVQLADLVALPQTQNSGPITGDYEGTVTLQRVFNGIYSDTVTLSNTIDLGYIDIVIHLEQSGNVVNGFIGLDRTLVFTQEHQIMVTPVGLPVGQGTPTPTPQPLAIGPLIQGSFDGTTLRMLSEPFSMNLNEQRQLNDGRILRAGRITRQFRLITTGVQNDGATLTGEYRETIWGYASYPSTVIGTFTLQRPIFAIEAKPTDSTPSSGPTPTPSPTPIPNAKKVFLPLVSR